MAAHRALSTSPLLAGRILRQRLGAVSAAGACASVVLVATAAGAAPGPLRKGPYLQEVTATSASVRFEVDPPAPATLEVRAEDGDGGASPPSTVTAREPAAFHAIAVTGLEPHRRYRYVVKVGGASEGGAFVTAPGPAPEEGASSPFVFLIYGDNRTDEVAHAAVVRAVAQAAGDFLVNTGDYVMDGRSGDDWQTFFDVERGLLKDRPVFGCVGNHELLDSTGGNFLRFFGPRALTGAPTATLAFAPSTAAAKGAQGAKGTPVVRAAAAALAPAAPAAEGGAPPRAQLFWSIRWGMVRFFMLNAFDTWLEGDERQWLEDQLARSEAEPGVVWRIAVLHHGPYASGPHGPNVPMQNARIPALLVRRGIDLVLSGHDHLYERGAAQGLRFVVSGGGGAPLYRVGSVSPYTRKVEPAYHFIEAQVTDAALKLITRRADGSLLEECGIVKGKAGWDCDAQTSLDTPRPASGEGAAPPPPPSKCACRVVGGGPRTKQGAVGSLFAVASLAAVARLRRRRRPSARRG